MAFVLPAGDYERALRMAGASNFMEALEAGIDRGMQRQAMRERAARARDLYDRQKALQSANLQAEFEEIGEGAYAAQQAGRVAAIPTVTSGSSVPIAAQAAVQAVAQDIAQDAAQSTGRAAPSAILYGDQSGVVSMQDVPSRGIAYGPGSGVISMQDVPRRGVSYGPGSGVVSVEDALRNEIAYGPGTGVASVSEDRFRLPPPRGGVVSIEDAPQNRRVVFDEGSTVVGGGSPLLGPELPPGYSPPQRQYTQQELALGTPSPAGIYGPRRPVGVVTDDPSPDMYKLQRGGMDYQERKGRTEFVNPLVGRQLAEALRLVEQGRTVDAQEVLGTTGKAYPPVDVETVTEGSPIPFGAAPPPDSDLPGEPLTGSLEAIAGEAGVLGADFERVLDVANSYREAGMLDVADALEEYADTLIPREQLSGGGAPAAPAGGGGGALGLPTGGLGSFATQAAGVTAALSDDPVLAAARALQASAGGGALPGAGEMAGVSTADQRMSGAVRGEPTTVVPSRIPDNPTPEDLYRALGREVLAAREQFKTRSPEEMLGIAPRNEGVDQTTQQEQRRLQGIEENALGAGVTGDLLGATPGTPLEQAVSQQAAVAEEVELAGPEPEAVKADQTVDVAGKAYTVKKGDTLGRVSSSFGAPLASVVVANQDVLAPGGKPRQIKRGGKVVLEGQDLIYAGDRIRIPTGEGRETGGEAGPVDPRPVTTVTGPGGQVTSSEGVLARVQRANKTNAQVKAALEKEQRKTPDLPLNPFQKFGRAIDYTPSLKAVAFATLRAQQGDFTMLNQLAGRQVRNSEIPGLFAEYSEFVRGAKGRAKEVYLQQELLKETQANEAKLRALTGVKAMALTQFRRAGYTDEDAQIFAGHYADLYAADPQQARAWSTSLNSMGSDRAKAEAARLKRSGSRRDGPGLGTDKQIESAEKRVGKLTEARRKAISLFAGVRGVREGMAPDAETLKSLQSDPAYAAIVRSYLEAEDRYQRGVQELNLLKYGPPPPEEPFELPEGLSAVEFAESNKDISAASKQAMRGELGWDKFERVIALKTSPEVAAEITEYYKSKPAPVDTGAIGGYQPKAKREEFLSEKQKAAYDASRDASLKVLNESLERLPDEIESIRLLAASGSTSSALRRITRLNSRFEGLADEVEEISGERPEPPKGMSDLLQRLRRPTREYPKYTSVR